MALAGLVKAHRIEANDVLAELRSVFVIGPAVIHALNLIKSQERTVRRSIALPSRTIFRLHATGKMHDPLNAVLRPTAALLGRLIALFMMLALASMARATTLMEESFEDLVSKADGILIGTVDDIRAGRGADQDIYTFVTLTQLEVVKGSYSQNAFTLRILGGELNDEGLHIEGAPQFDLHERVMVFLRGNGESMVPIVGWTQGVFRLPDDSGSASAVLDHDRNHVLGLRNNRVVKEVRFRPKASVVGQAIGRALSAKPSADAGITHDASTSRERQTVSPVEVSRRPLNRQAFITAIRSQVRKDIHSGRVDRPLRSTDDLGDLPAEPRRARADSLRHLSPSDRTHEPATEPHAPLSR